VAISLAASRSVADELAEIEAWYRDRLTRPAVEEVYEYPPVKIGPTWQRDGRYWLLPERSLGWQMLAWTGRWLQHSRDVPWRWTDEQARFLLWWYALDEDTWRWVYRDFVLQRLKGWGKDPLGAGKGMFELVGPARVGDVVDGQPVGVEVLDAWVQTAAVSLEQTKNTMRLLPGMVTPEAKIRFDLQIGKEQVHAMGGERLFQAVTSAPTTLEGARPTDTLKNETQHWDSSNGGHEMSAVIERNATKSASGAARTGSITNAYEPGRDSVGERDRDAWDAVQAGTAVDTGLLYDSLEAPPEAPLTLEAAPAVVRAIRGDSTWLDVERIVQSIADRRNPPSRSRRFWYNQITAAEDAWTSPQEFDALGAAEELADGEKVVMFGDGSKSDDCTALVACRISDGKAFQLGVWGKPAGYDDRYGPWIVNRDDVDHTVEDTFERLTVVAFWFDPSDTRDESGERYWDAYCDRWHRRHGKKLKLWSVKTGDKQHSVTWDMRSPQRMAEFTAAAERCISDIEAGQLAHDNSAALRQHVKNARRRPGKYGVGLGKEHRESARKVDLAVCMVGARMMWRLWTNKHRPRSTGQRQIILPDN